MPNGYTKLGRNGKTWLGHRYAWAQLVGDIPDGKLVLHGCDNRACCRPSHLFLGTHVDNMQDMIRKGRQDFSHLHTGPWIENLPRRFSLAQMAEMVRLRVEERLALQAIADRFGTSDKYVSAICSRKAKNYERFRVNG